MNKNKIKFFSFVWIFIAAILFALRYIKIINVDYGLFGSTYITFSEKVTNCSLPVMNVLDTCKNIDLINIVWWSVIGVLVVIQLFVLFKNK